MKVDRTKQLNVNIHYINGKMVYENTTPIHVKGITIPRGFLTDGYSIPTWLRWFISPSELPLLPAFYHDYTYIKNPLNISRKQCDKEFFELMREYGARKNKATRVYYGVRIGSWYFWNKFRKGNK